MMNKEQKKNYISEMKKFFESSDSVLVTHYQGLSVNQLDVLRAEMRKHGIMFKITKTTGESCVIFFVSKNLIFLHMVLGTWIK